MERLIWVLSFLQVIVLTNCWLHQYPKLVLGERDKEDAGSPLFLTPYVESGNIAEGRNLARVPFTDDLGIKSYSGFFTVNKTYNSNQFFWYFPAMIPNNTFAPVVLWLQGGPGGSSLYGLFVENGPIMVNNGRFERRKYHWALSHHLIYIDNPVGAGFSFTDDNRGYCTTEAQICEHLYSTLTQFFQLFPELQQNKFFVTGESYAGKYVPALAYTIHKRNPTANIKINLKGMAIGNGLSDPEHQLVYSDYLYQIGLIDWNQAKILKDVEKQAISYIQQKNYIKANTMFNLITGYFILHFTGFAIYYNYLNSEDNISKNFISLLQKGNTRKNIHVGELPFKFDSSEVHNHLSQDMMRSVAPLISELLDHYTVVTYNGQLDIIVAYPLTVNYLRNLNFTGSEEYKTATRYIWKVDGEIAGYVKHAGKLVEILVRNAGHMVPIDQPKWALDLITRLTHEKSYIEVGKREIVN